MVRFLGVLDQLGIASMLHLNLPLSLREAREIYAKRSPEIEGVFGQIKNNRGLRRTVLRGLEKEKTSLKKPKASRNARF